MAQKAGLCDIVLNPKSGYVDAMLDWQDPLYQKIIEKLPAGTKPGEYITSLEVTARKPGTLKSENNPKGIQVFDPPMCCSTGVCGPNLDLGTFGWHPNNRSLGNSPAEAGIE